MAYETLKKRRKGFPFEQITIKRLTDFMVRWGNL